MNILFICKYNRFRSKVAQAYFNSQNPRGSIAKSAGLVPGIPITKDIILDCRRSGIEISGKPTGLTHPLLMWSDVIIIISDSIPVYLFSEEIKNDKKKVIIWSIIDAKSRRDRPRIIKEIKRRVDRLL